MVAFLPLTSFSIVAGFCLQEVLGLRNVTVDDTYPRVVYSGIWRPTLSGDGMDVGGSYRVADGDGEAYATFTFTGVALYFHSPKWPYHINTDLSLDGGPVTTIDLQDYAHKTLVASGATAPSTVVASWVGLANTRHTLLISKGRNEPFAVLDALTYTVLDATDIAGTTSSKPPIKASFRTWRNSRRYDSSDSSSTFLGLPAIVGLVIAIIFVKLMVCIWCVWFRRRRYVRPVQVYPPASYPPPPPPYQSSSPLFPITNPNFPSATPPRPLDQAYPLTPVSPYGPPKPVEPHSPYGGFNTMPTRRPGSGPITRHGDEQPNDPRLNPDGGRAAPAFPTPVTTATTTFPAATTTFPAAATTSPAARTTFPAAATTFSAAATTFPATATTFPAAVTTFPPAWLAGRDAREPIRQDPRIAQADGLATPNPAVNSTHRTTPGSEKTSVRPSSGGDLPPPPEYTAEDGNQPSKTAGKSDGNVNAVPDGRPTASNFDGSGNRLSEFSVPQPLSFMPIN